MKQILFNRLHLVYSGGSKIIEWGPTSPPLSQMGAHETSLQPSYIAFELRITLIHVFYIFRGAYGKIFMSERYSLKSCVDTPMPHSRTITECTYTSVRARIGRHIASLATLIKPIATSSTLITGLLLSSCDSVNTLIYKSN